MQSREKAVIICSGGLDSTVLLYYVMDLGYVPYILTFDYGQKHKIEIDHAKKMFKKLGLMYTVMKIPKLGGSALTDNFIDIPKEDYSVETQRSTVVPNRNMVFLSIAASYAILIGAKRVYYAAHHNDEAVYPDCRLEFVDALNEALNEGNYETVRVWCPFIKMTKTKVVEIGEKLGVPFEDTWSCYDPVIATHVEGTGLIPADWGSQHMHCGVCGTCRERKNAFEVAGVEDPTVYAEVRE